MSTAPIQTPATSAPLPTLGDALAITQGHLVLSVDSQDGTARPYSGIRFWSDDQPRESYRERIVLAAGVGPAGAGPVLEYLRDANAAAVVVGPSAATTIRETREAGGPVILELRGGDWAQIAASMRALLSDFAHGPVSRIDAGDLFGFANALAVLASGATSIVSASGQVVGYSTLAEQPIDETRRRSTLLLKEVVAIALDEDYRTIERSRQAVFFPATHDELARVGIAVRSAGELLGSIWIIHSGSHPPARTQALLDEIAPLAAQHLLIARERVAEQDQRSSTLLAELLEARADAKSAALQLLLRPDAECVVVCFRLDSVDETTSVRGLQLLARLVRSMASSTFADAHTAILGPAVVVLASTSSRERIVAFAEAVAAPASPVYAGVGRHARSVPEVARSYRDAVLSAALLLQEATTGGPASPGASRIVQPAVHTEQRVARFEQVRERLAMRDLEATLVQSAASEGDAASRLRRHDEVHGTGFAATVLCYFELRESVRATASALHVHQNTVRYRLDFVKRELGVDLDDADVRLWLWLRLRSQASQARSETERDNKV